MTSYADKKFTGKRNSETGITYQNTHQEEYKEKLKQTTIMNQDFAKVMKQYDSKQTFHYLDPPYDGTQNVYKEGDFFTTLRRFVRLQNECAGK